MFPVRYQELRTFSCTFTVGCLGAFRFCSVPGGISGRTGGGCDLGDGVGDGDVCGVFTC